MMHIELSLVPQVADYNQHGRKERMVDLYALGYGSPFLKNMASESWYLLFGKAILSTRYLGYPLRAFRRVLELTRS
jgi:hypothetical protein